MSYRIEALAPGTWDAFAGLVERHNGVFGGCWCTWFHTLMADKPKDRTAEDNREFKRRLVEEGRAHAALVFDGEAAVAWAEYGPPCELPNIKHRKQYAEETDLEPDFRITCMFVDRRYRHQGLLAVALNGALDLIARHGGGIVEAYPHDTAHYGAKKVAVLYSGTRALFERAGFDYIRPKGEKNCVMRKTVR